MSSQTVLIPIRFPDPEPLPSTFVEGLTSAKVVLLGVYDLPSETSADERHRREIEAYRTLYALAHQFVQRGDTADVELVMGTDLEAVPTEIAEERGVDALLIPNPINTLGRVLIPIRDAKFSQPTAEFVSTLDQDVVIHATLLYVADEEGEEEAGEQLLSEVRRQLVDAGFSQSAVDTEVVVSDDPSMAISQAAGSYDLIVMGETQESAAERIFGKTYELVAERTQLPIIVLRED